MGTRVKVHAQQPLHWSTNARPWSSAIPSASPTSWRPHRMESSPPSISSTILTSEPTSTKITFPPTADPSAFFDMPSFEPMSKSLFPSATQTSPGDISRAPSQLESNVPSSQQTLPPTIESPVPTRTTPTALPSIGNEATVNPTSSPSSTAPLPLETNVPSSQPTPSSTIKSLSPSTSQPSIGTEHTVFPTTSSPASLPYPSITYPPTTPSPQPFSASESAAPSSENSTTAPPSITFSMQQCLDSIGDIYGSKESIGDGWCDDYSLSKEGTLFDLNSQMCGFDGGDCCIQSCNRSASIYGCRISGLQCKDPRYINQSLSSNFSLSVLATNVTHLLGEIESNAVFLLGLQYQIQDATDPSTRVSVISSVSSNFTTMFGRPIVIVNAVVTTYSETESAASFKGALRHSETSPESAQLPALERSVRLAAERVNSEALIHVVLCRNGIGAENCIVSGNPSVLPMSRGHSVQYSCGKYENSEWNTLYRTPSRFPVYAAVIILLALLWGLTAGKSSFFALRMKVNSSMKSEQLHDTVFFFWMLTIASLLRFIYFVWLISWPTSPSLRQSSNDYSSTFSFIACREFLVLTYDQMMSLERYAPGAYQLIIGWFYCALVTSVLILLQNENKRALEEERSSAGEVMAIRNHCSRILRFLTTLGMGVVALSFMLVTSTGMMLLILPHLHIQQGPSKSASSAGTISLLVVQSVCGLLLCGCGATGFFIQSTFLHLSNGRNRTQQEKCSVHCTTIAALCVALGCVFLVSANETVLYHAVSAFPSYSLIPRVLELTLVTKMMNLAAVFDHGPRPRRPDRLNSSQQQSSFRQMNIDANALPNTPGRPSSNRLFFDRFMDAESHLYPKWIRYWRNDEEFNQPGDVDVSFHEKCLPPSAPQLSHQPHLEVENPRW